MQLKVIGTMKIINKIILVGVEKLTEIISSVMA
jgi:hypothetical protein